MELDDRRRGVCKVCLTQFARYICPRCNIAYCSLACYKAHNERCTESFSREQAVSDLQEVHAEPAERKKVLKLLQRVAAQQAADDAVLQAGGIPSATATYDVTDDLEGIDDSHEGEEQDLSSDSEGEDDGGGESSADEQPGSSMSAHDKAGRRSIAVTPGARGRQRQARGKTSDTAKGLKLSRATIDRLVAKARRLRQGEELVIDHEDLAPEDLKRFERALAAGQLNHLVDVVQPWWLSGEAHELNLTSQGQRRVVVQEASVQEPAGPVARADDAQPPAQQQQQLPAASADPLVPVSSLTKATPSPLLRWQLLQVLYGYCWVMRRYNGEPGLPEVATEAVHLLLAVCPLLAMGVTAAQRPVQPAGGQPQPPQQQQPQGPVMPQSPGVALLECITRACVPPAGDATSRAVAVAILQDVMSLLQCGGAAVVLALTDLRRLVQAAVEANDIPSAVDSRQDARASRKKHSRALLAAVQKLWFFMCWANDLRQAGPESSPPEYGDAVFDQLLAGCVAAEWERHVASVSSQQSAGQALEPHSLVSDLKQFQISS